MMKKIKNRERRLREAKICATLTPKGYEKRKNMIKLRVLKTEIRQRNASLAAKQRRKDNEEN